MTLKEFENYNKEKNMPYEWIGQGYGYKEDWNPLRPDDIIYIPEHAYEDDNTVSLDATYTYKDFVDLCDGDVDKAEKLHDYVDWQTPETVLDEWEKEN